MLMTFALLVAGAQNCSEVKQQCRTCVLSNGKQQCSNIGIACQPSLRLCRPKEVETQSKGKKAAKPNVG